MPEVVGVRFRRAGPVYYFDPAGIELEVDNWVVVETARGLNLGRVIISPKQVLASEIAEPLKPVVRKAEEGDLKRKQDLEGTEKEAFLKGRELIGRFGLPMKLLAAEYNLEGSHLTFYFSAEERVDFRALVRELSSTFKVKVELRQVGSRDEAKMLGGFGRCGRPLCCASHLTHFESISMRMAKEQDLPLNPAKISGVCGRLLCCLAYESELYRLLKQKLPRVGEAVTTPLGPAKVVGASPLKEKVLVQLQSEVTLELPLSEISFAEGSNPQGPGISPASP